MSTDGVPFLYVKEFADPNKKRIVMNPYPVKRICQEGRDAAVIPASSGPQPLLLCEAFFDRNQRRASISEEPLPSVGTQELLIDYKYRASGLLHEAFHMRPPPAYPCKSSIPPAVFCCVGSMPRAKSPRNTLECIDHPLFVRCVMS